MADVIVYMTSVSSSSQMASQLQRVEMVLAAKKIEFTKVDVSSDRDLLGKMRDIIGDPKATPIQFCKGSTYLGNYENFDEAIETDSLKEFFKLE